MLNRHRCSYLLHFCFWLLMSNSLGVADFFSLFILETDQTVASMAGKHYSRETSPRICHFQSCENTCFQVITFKPTKKVPCLIKNIRRQSKQEKNFIFFIIAHSLDNPLQRIHIMHEEYRGVKTESYSFGCLFTEFDA